MKLKKDFLVRIFYKNSAQDSLNPEPDRMYNMEKFENAQKAYEWYIKKQNHIHDVIVTSGSESFDVNFSEYS